MGRCSEETISELLKPTLIKLNLKNYVIDFSGITEKGDGYLGDITFVRVAGKIGDGVVKEVYEFVIKSGKTSKKLRDLMPVRKAFTNEIYVYNRVLPLFKKFQQKKGIKDPFNNYPKCYGTNVVEDMEIIVLQNLKTEGYQLWNRKLPMPLDHLLAVVKTYAKLHAISFGMKDQNSEAFKDIGGKLIDMYEEFSKLSDPNEPIAMFKNIIEIAKKKNKIDIATKTEELQTLLSKQRHQAEPDNPFAVILHGDCWNNNFMFKYEDDKISHVSLLDFQLSRIGSPVYDLSYFLFTCMSDEGIENFDLINRTYHEELCIFLEELGSDPKTVFPYEQLQEQWKRFAVFGMINVPVILKLVLSDEDEVTDMTEIAENKQNLADAFFVMPKNFEEFEKRSMGIFQLAVDRGFMLI